MFWLESMISSSALLSTYQKGLELVVRPVAEMGRDGQRGEMGVRCLKSEFHICDFLSG